MPSNENENFSGQSTGVMKRDIETTGYNTAVLRCHKNAETTING